MPTTFTATLNRFRALSELSNAEEIAIKQATLGKDNMFTLGTEASEKYLDEPRPREAALVAFIAQLPDADIFALTALMYAGRDNNFDLTNLWASLRSAISTKGTSEPKPCGKISKTKIHRYRAPPTAA